MLQKSREEVNIKIGQAFFLDSESVQHSGYIVFAVLIELNDGLVSRQKLVCVHFFPVILQVAEETCGGPR